MALSLLALEKNIIGRWFVRYTIVVPLSTVQSLFHNSYKKKKKKDSTMLYSFQFVMKVEHPYVTNLNNNLYESTSARDITGGRDEIVINSLVKISVSNPITGTLRRISRIIETHVIGDKTDRRYNIL